MLPLPSQSSAQWDFGDRGLQWGELSGRGAGAEPGGTCRQAFGAEWYATLACSQTGLTPPQMACPFPEAQPTCSRLLGASAQSADGDILHGLGSPYGQASFWGHT